MLYEYKKQVLDGFIRITPLVVKGHPTPVGEPAEFDEPSIMADGYRTFINPGEYLLKLREYAY